MSENDDSVGRRDARRQKGRRFATGLNSGIAIMLAMALLGLVATIAYRYVKVRWDLSSLRYYTLSDKTHSMLSGIEGRNTRHYAFRAGCHAEGRDSSTAARV